MLTTVRLVNTSFASHNYHFGGVTMLKPYSDNNFKMYNTVLQMVSHHAAH